MALRRSNKILFLTAAALILIFGTYAFAERAFIGQFKIFYSLDKKENDQEIIKVINGAHQYIYFAIYTFSKDDIADALVAAKARGLTVEGITDQEESTMDYEKPILEKLRAAGIPVETQIHTDGIMHIKAIVTDNAYALGSYNWTDSATYDNDELLEVGTNNNLREQYLSIIRKIIAVNQPANPSASTIATTSAPVSISYADANSYIGKNATVSGAPVRVYTSAKGTVFFDYCVDYKNCPFSVTIFADDAKNFPDLAGYQGKTISVTGVISSYQGKAEMVVSDPSQIK